MVTLQPKELIINTINIKNDLTTTDFSQNYKDALTL